MAYLRRQSLTENGRTNGSLRSAYSSLNPGLALDAKRPRDIALRVLRGVIVDPI
mgnify:CR=1 FL=1